MSSRMKFQPMRLQQFNETEKFSSEFQKPSKNHNENVYSFEYLRNNR